MAKGKIKKRKTNPKKASTSSTKNYSKKKIKPRKSTLNSMPKNIKIAGLVLLVLILVLCFINLGLVFTIITALGIGIILWVANLLDKYKNDKKKKKLISIILIAVLGLGVLCLIMFVAFLVYITVNAPKFDVKELDKKEVTIIYDKDGNEITKLGTEMREKITYDELPQVLVDAIVATEDSRYFQHNGFDAPRFLKATAGQVLGNSDAGGASTLSMQVIKNTFTSTQASGVQGIVRKFTDIYLAVFKLEKTYSKQEIIEYYVNNHFLGGNIYGVQEASREYFGKDVTDLNLSEAAIIAGMFKSPNYYRPNVNPKNATERRNTVLYLMKRHGYINDAEYNLAKSIPVESLTAEESNASTSDYQGYIDTVVEEVKDKYKVNPYTVPLLIYTNMDRAKQDGVNSVLKGDTYTWINDVVQTGVSVLDSSTGKIQAIGAGRNRSGASTLNYATQIKRQPGSTAKPLFDYGPGIEYNNWSTYTLFDDAPYTYSNGRSIKNWDNGYYGTITLRRALSASRNIPALKAFQQVDNAKIIEFVEGLGITPEVENGRIHEAHSIGAFTGVNSLQMAAAYAAFSNGGFYNEPYSVSKIVFRDSGKEEEHKATKKQVMSDATAFMISSVLQDVSITGGKPANVAAKTGTTNFDEAYVKSKGLPSDAIRDSWVVGYTTKTVIGMWYGYNTSTPEYCLRNLPATIQKDKLFLALANAAFEKNKEAFKQPDSVVKLGIIAGSNPAQVAPAGFGGSIVYEFFKKDHQPAPTDTATESKLATPSGLKATYDGSSAVNISWNAVNRLSGDEQYGDLVYNVYLGNTLIKVTTDTSYKHITNSPYGTYRVVATYKSYGGAQSSATSYTLKEEVQADNLTGECNPVNGKEVDSTESIPLTSSGLTCSVKNNGTTLTSGSYTVKGNTPTCTADGSSCQVTYSATYNSKTYNLNTVTYTIKRTTPEIPPAS